MTVFDRSILAAPALDAARALLGALLVREPEVEQVTDLASDEPGLPADRAPDEVIAPRPILEPRVGRIVEVEAYGGPADEASHARFGSTGRSSVMFGPPGVAYVYLVYGMYDALNVVTEPAGSAAAVLIRAVEPLAGAEAMRAARLRLVASRRRPAARGSGAAWVATERDRLHAIRDVRLASGPGLLAAAFGVDRSFTGIDMCGASSSLRLEAAPDRPSAAIVAGPRVGVGYAPEPWRSAPWRLALAGHPSVSRPAIARSA